MPAASLRLGELVATFALAQDNAFGQPLESQLRSCLLATWLSEEAGYGSELRQTIYWVALLRYIGCTGHAHEVATVFGDEIAIRARTLIHDAANPTEVLSDAVAFITAFHPPEERDRILAALKEGAHEYLVHNFASGCEVADMLALRLGCSPAVREALAHTFERWNGTGYPSGASGESIPLAMRVVHLTHDMEAIARLFSPAEALEAARERRDRTYDPVLVDLFVEHGGRWFDRLARTDPWDAVLALEPEPHRILRGTALDEALMVVADFIDLKSPYSAGHSRRCAQLAAEAARVMGFPEGAVTALRRAALVHDFGATAVPNSIWDKPGPLTRSEFDRVELHPMLTEQMLRRTDTLDSLNPIACAHHERADGSGYHKRHSVDGANPGACILAAVEIFVGITTERADRPPYSEKEAAEELRSLVSRGGLEPRVTEAVLTAAGQGKPRSARSRRSRFPGGLSRRQVEVLNLTAKGLTTQQIADRLSISPKTADHHIQHIYTKIGVSTRAAAALWAMQNAVVV